MNNQMTSVKAAAKLQRELPNWVWVRTRSGGFSGTFEGVRKNMYGPFVQVYTNRLVKVYLSNIHEIQTSQETMQVVSYTP